MKKVLLSLSIVAGLGMTSCGVDVEAAASEFCACSEKEGDDKTACHDEWVAKYKDARGSEEDGEKLVEKMLECDAASAISVASKLAE